MKSVLDISAPSIPALEKIGGKAFSLCRLYNMGLPVPKAIVIPADVYDKRENVDLIHLHDQIIGHEVVAEGTMFAVRSSGIGEDGDDSSFAGIFESYLNVPRDKLHEALNDVWASLNSPRSTMYSSERSVTISSMSVVIQHMVAADYAGVAFSTSPVDGDDRIALLEVVKGNGDSLVSGKKTPATLRINKVTGMVRITRKGEDDLATELLEDISAKIMPLTEKIAIEYGMPVDVEWAIAENQAYILQARPITA